LRQAMAMVVVVLAAPPRAPWSRHLLRRSVPVGITTLDSVDLRGGPQLWCGCLSLFAAARDLILQLARPLCDDAIAASALALVRAPALPAAAWGAPGSAQRPALLGQVLVHLVRLLALAAASAGLQAFTPPVVSGFCRHLRGEPAAWAKGRGREGG
jgi:hypothetical protein